MTLSHVFFFISSSFVFVCASAVILSLPPCYHFFPLLSLCFLYFFHVPHFEIPSDLGALFVLSPFLSYTGCLCLESKAILKKKYIYVEASRFHINIIAPSTSVSQKHKTTCVTKFRTSKQRKKRKEKKKIKASMCGVIQMMCERRRRNM